MQETIRESRSSSIRGERDIEGQRESEEGDREPPEGRISDQRYQRQSEPADSGDSRRNGTGETIERGGKGVSRETGPRDRETLEIEAEYPGAETRVSRRAAEGEPEEPGEQVSRDSGSAGGERSLRREAPGAH